ncbi:IS66 family insertion sequence element accessory protein TnpA [Pendulispora brunnea]|uniref:IS66 family insertion sequence element accessory protein TnpA n=1 Tax=Pendulispora brunnea TaxID=2905690 RepID=UPI00374E0B26
MTAIQRKWEARVAAWKASGQTYDEFAEGRGFAGASLRRWVLQLEKEDREAKTEELAPIARQESPMAPVRREMSREYIRHFMEVPPGRTHGTEARRARAIELHKQGVNGAQIGRELGVTREAVRQWIAAYRESGLAGLIAKPRLGAQPKLSHARLAALGALLAESATAHGFDSDGWTATRVAALILRYFGVRYHPDHVGRLLRRHILDWQTRRGASRDSDGRTRRPRTAPRVFLLWGMRPHGGARRSLAL